MKMSIVFVLSVVGSAFAQPTIYNPSALRNWATAVQLGERADVVMLGDSNQLYSAYGWNGGWIRSMRSHIGIYATGLTWCGEAYGLGNGDGDGFGVVSVGGNSIFQFTNAPSEIRDYITFGSATSQYLYYASGDSNGARNWGMSIDSGLHVYNSLKFWLTDATFPVGGYYQPVCRLGQSPYTQLVNFGTVSTGGGYGIRTSSYTLPFNATRTGSIQFLFTPYSFSNVLEGPFLPVLQRVEEVGANGASVHTLYSYGGKSGRYMSNVMSQASDSFLTTWFTEARRLQGTNKHFLIRISQGLNDVNETLPSVGNGITPGNSSSAFADNIYYTIDRINHIWTINGWNSVELSYLVDVGHAISTPQDSRLEGYVDSLLTVSGFEDTYNNVAVCDLSTFMGETEMSSLGYYSSSDHYHLTTNGYTALSEMEVTAVLNTAIPYYCPADYNHDNGVDGEDIGDFISDWSNGYIAADFNHDGGIDGTDVSDFFAEWETGC